jgi:hypothetical protein
MALVKADRIAQPDGPGFVGGGLDRIEQKTRTLPIPQIPIYVGLTVDGFHP